MTAAPGSGHGKGRIVMSARSKKKKVPTKLAPVHRGELNPTHLVVLVVLVTLGVTLLFAW